MNKVKIAIIGLSGQSIFMNIDEFHKEGETKQAKKVFIEPGGKGYNQAIACSRFGADVYYLSSVGSDEYAKVCEDYMKKEGINTFFISKKENTAIATIITNDKGDNQVTVYKGANDLLTLDDLEIFKETIKACDILLLQNEIPYDVLKEAINFAKSQNVYVILNPAPAVYDLNEVLDLVDLLIPNETEAYQIYNKKIEDLNVKNTIITLGSKGCVYINGNNKKYYDSIKVNVVDTTGAGDVFCAGIAVKIKNSSIDEAINFATKVASLHIQKPHVLDAIPYIKK